MTNPLGARRPSLSLIKPLSGPDEQVPPKLLTEEPIFFPRREELARDVPKYSQDLFKFLMIIMGAGLILILYYVEDWFHGYLRGEQNPSLMNSHLVIYDTPDAHVPRSMSELSWYEKWFCRGAGTSSSCSYHKSGQ